MSTADQSRRFARNLQTLMDRRGLTVREVAKRAGIADIKRLYRWVSKGISRAHHEHEDDLERLRCFFGLSSFGQFWREQPHQTLADRLREAGEFEWEYGYAFKVLVALKAMGPDRSSRLSEAIDDLFGRENLARRAEAILQPKNAEEVVSHIEINHPETYRRLLELLSEGRPHLVWSLDQLITKRHMNPLDVLDWVLKKAWAEAEGRAGTEQNR